MNRNLDIKKRIIIIFSIVNVCFSILCIRVGIIQFAEGEKWSKKSEEQRNSSRSLIANRGTIYDASGEIVLAQSSSVETVTVSPVNIPIEKKEDVAKILSEIFEIDYDKVLKRLNKYTSIENIARRVDREKTNRLREWMENNNCYDGINIDEDTKRFYPYSTLASHVIGFIGSDNQGLDGIEAKYNDILTGKNGSISKVLDAKGKQIENTSELFSDSTKGNDIILTIDMNIQAIVEKYLEEACIDNICTDGANVIVMDPRSGDVLALANYPYYNLNEPYKINNEELEIIWSELDSGQKSLYLQSMWRNKAIQDTYEPGSTFKLVTASAALEEGIAVTDKPGAYNCSGSIEIAGRRIKCWRYYRPHGAQSLREALMNSCNPVFIGLGQKIGVSKYYEYLQKFGFLDKTGIDLVGEARAIFLKEEKVGPLELATISFGQRFEVTPI